MTAAWFTPADQSALADFWSVFDAHHAEVTAAVAASMTAHPSLAEFRRIDFDRLCTEGRDLVTGAVSDGDWQPYAEHLRERAAEYDEAGLSFDTWHHWTRVAIDAVSPLLVEAFWRDPGRLAAALRAMGRFFEQVVVILAAAFNRANQVALVARSSAAEQRLRALAAKLHKMMEEERSHIARELHDELGQQLTALRLDIAWVSRRYASEDRAVLDLRFSAMTSLVDETVRTVRRVATQLRPVILDHLGLSAALEWQADELSTRTGIRVDMQLSTDDLRLPSDHATAIFRAFQELLTNVLRHAGARSVHVRLDVTADEVAMTVRDDGRGITETQANSASSLGLLGIRERVALLGGTCHVDGQAGRGTAVSIALPLALDVPASSTRRELRL